MPKQELKTMYLKLGDLVNVEYTSVDETKDIKNLYVIHFSIKNGKGYAIFDDQHGNTYLWRPEIPHGTVLHINNTGERYLLNPYVTVYNKDSDTFDPVDCYSGTYFSYEN